MKAWIFLNQTLHLYNPAKELITVSFIIVFLCVCSVCSYIALLLSNETKLRRYSLVSASVWAVMDLFSCIYLCIILVLSNFLMIAILKFHNTVLLINRNIVTYLNTFLVISMNVCTSVQVMGFKHNNQSISFSSVWVFCWGFFMGLYPS